MSDQNYILPPILQTIIDDFQLSEGREKIELLLEYSEHLIPLPEKWQEDRASMEPVEECMTPVFIAAEFGHEGLHFYFDIPPESPTVRGFAALMAEGLEGTMPEDVLRIPNDFYLSLGLEDVLTMQRLNGFSAILVHLKRLASSMLE
ncbi:MAG: SufE family protein [Anaerolineales bacterium]|nr:MAG: SufE family protein [Anaerolineales bacterium]